MHRLQTEILWQRARGTEQLHESLQWERVQPCPSVIDLRNVQVELLEHGAALQSPHEHPVKLLVNCRPYNGQNRDARCKSSCNGCHELFAVGTGNGKVLWCAAEPQVLDGQLLGATFSMLCTEELQSCCECG